MRMHIELDDRVVAGIDAVAGPRGRSAFVRRAVERALEDELRWQQLTAAAASIPSEGHAWDDDPAQWVHDQRRTDGRRIG